LDDLLHEADAREAAHRLLRVADAFLAAVEPDEDAEYGSGSRPTRSRQLFNDTDADQLWLVGAPPEAVTSTLEMSDEQLRFMYPDGPKALPPGLGEG